MAKRKRASKLDERYTIVGNSVESSEGGRPAVSRTERIPENPKHISLELEDREEFIIIGDDNRVKVNTRNFPYNVICYLSIYSDGGNCYYGTGFFISKRCVVTAGHCVFFRGGWARSITVIPGADGFSRPYGSSVATKFKSVKGWTVNKNRNFDHGAVILDDDTLYNQVQNSFIFNDSIGEKVIEISGYPFDKEATQWKSEGGIIRRSKYRLFYELDTIKGNSGSPVFTDSKVVIGVHNFGENPNCAIRVNADVQNIWKAWSSFT